MRHIDHEWGTYEEERKRLKGKDGFDLMNEILDELYSEHVRLRETDEKTSERLRRAYDVLKVAMARIAE